MSSQSAVAVRASVPRTSPCCECDENDLEAAFIYADEFGRMKNERGHVDLRGDVYDDGDERVGHVAATMADVGEIFRGEDNRWGHVRISPNGDGYVYIDVPDDSRPHNYFLRGVVTVRGDVYEGHYARKVGVVMPPLDVERMGAAALLLGLLSPASHHLT